MNSRWNPIHLDSKIKEFKSIYLQHRATIYSYLNIGISSLELTAFYYIGTPAWFVCVIFFRFVLSWILFFGRKQRHAKICQVWCLSESCMIVSIMAIGLSRFVKLSKFGISVACVSFVFKMYGLWVVYYFSLEVQNDISVYFRQNTAQVQLQNATPSTSNSQHANKAEDKTSNLLEESQNFENTEKENVIDDETPVQYSVIYM